MMPIGGQTVRAVSFGIASDIQNAPITGFTNTSYTAGSPICGTSFVAPPSGKVKIVWTSYAESNTNGERVFVSIRVRTGAIVGSGKDVLTPFGEWSIVHGDSSSGAASRLNASLAYPLDGLTPGRPYNVRTVHAISAGNGDIFYRSVWVGARF